FDAEAFRALIEFQIAEGISGIVPVGTTGESPTVTHEEHMEIIRVAIETAKGRCKVIAGTGSNSTAEAIALTVEAEKMGADAALLVAPYYNKPTPEGLYRHYRAIAESVKIPLMLYSIPGRCGIEIDVPTVVRLAKDCPNIHSIKEAGGTVERVSQLRAALPDSFEIISGDDSLTLPFLSAGAIGVISVASNIIPREVAHLVAAWLKGKPEAAQMLHRKWYPFFKAIFVESNPVPTKAILAWQGKMMPDVRLPLVQMTETNVAGLRAVAAEYGLL
ncbi:MAG: 4-hydroxy-tetrahydrodipicolinate synthase, partial [Chthoniobacterales bacterium]